MSQSALQKKLKKGGQIEAASVSQEEVAKQAEALGITYFNVECDRARSRSAVLRAVVKAVDFPEFFGGNLDAFYDCLCDTVIDQKAGLCLWFHNLHSGDPTLEEDSKAIISVCEDVVEYAANNGRCFSFVVQHAGRHPDPEPGVAPVPYSGS
ncbi:MAG TPA: barstar family protein 2 [Pusillimonas sp.]|nr:barstar family protein 2 [Pusillimonas sp.]|tara:strand:+ start:196 stop:651 length:456 start_codon:yes stop_codon:yes gene_type:complete